MDGTAMPFPGKEEALELLKRDYVVDRIPEDMHQKLIDEAWELGKNAGRYFSKTTRLMTVYVLQM